MFLYFVQTARYISLLFILLRVQIMANAQS